MKYIILLTITLLSTGCNNRELPRATVEETAEQAWYMGRNALVIAKENKEHIERLENRCSE